MCSLPHSQAVAVSESDPLSRYCSVCVLVTLILVNSGPKSTAGDLDMPKRNRKVLPFSEKVHMHRKNIVYIGFGTIRGFRHPLWVLEQVP